MNTSEQAILQKFVLHASTVAKRMLNACYNRTAPAPIQAILDAALETLSCQEAQRELAARLSGIEAAHGARLLERMSAILETGCAPGSCFAAADATRDTVSALVCACGEELAASTASALRRLNLVLGLGQADTHAMVPHCEALSRDTE